MECLNFSFIVCVILHYMSLSFIYELSFVRIILQKLLSEVKKMEALGMADFAEGFRFSFKQFEKVGHFKLLITGYLAIFGRVYISW